MGPLHRFRMWVAGLFVGEIREQRELTANAYRDLARERAACADLLSQLHDAHRRIRQLEAALGLLEQIRDLPTTERPDR